MLLQLSCRSLVAPLSSPNVTSRTDIQSWEPPASHSQLLDMRSHGRTFSHLLNKVSNYTHAPGAQATHLCSTRPLIIMLEVVRRLFLNPSCSWPRCQTKSLPVSTSPSNLKYQHARTGTAYSYDLLLLLSLLPEGSGIQASFSPANYWLTRRPGWYIGW